MQCPICCERLPRHTDRCPGCGYRMPVSISTEPVQTSRSRSSRRRSLFPLVLRVLTLLSILAPLLLSLVRVVWTQLQIEEQVALPTPEYVATLPREDPLPTTAEGCFAIEGGAVTFLPGRWDGSPILTIPDTVDGKTVTTLAPGCFRDCTGLTTIILPETLTGIGSDAFSGCSGLRGLFLPEGVETIGENAFAGCCSLEAICIPATVTAIAADSFADCASLQYINYGSSFQDWNALYDDYITPFTIAICTDGSYYHGVPD